ncbi:hypothetical protein AX17_001927 [Amanita inopinata Kibby_2008]|nr:hypothetical protein AX17_001927 [Amanita inopinata Kibby_2008]
MPPTRRTCQPRKANSVNSTAPQTIESKLPTTGISHHNIDSPVLSSDIPSSSNLPSYHLPTITIAAPEPTKSQSHPSGFADGISSPLFPISAIVSSWTTSQSLDSALSLSDSTFRPTNMLSAIAPQYVNGPDGKKSMKVHFPEGSYTYKGRLGGVSFYAPGPPSVDLTSAKEATFGYTVYFEPGFAFNKGGKLPGLYGGNSNTESISCSGGRRSSACFSARLMWRTDGAGELYTYLPPSFSANKKLCHIAPLSDCNPVYGASVGRGAFHFAAGRWTTVAQRVKLNDVGEANGELELFVNGESVINVGGLILRDSSEGRIRGIQMQSFFGGSSSDWASPKAQDIYLSDFSVAITKNL